MINHYLKICLKIVWKINHISTFTCGTLRGALNLSRNSCYFLNFFNPTMNCSLGLIIFTFFWTENFTLPQILSAFESQLHSIPSLVHFVFDVQYYDPIGKMSHLTSIAT